MARFASASAEPPKEADPTQLRALPEVIPGDFQRTVPSQGVDRPPAVREIETQREHLRLNLENWEKQWADVLRYERAKVQDEADLATLRRALTRSGACVALVLSLSIPVITNGRDLQSGGIGVLTFRDLALMGSAIAATVMLSSLWYAGHLWLRRQSFKKGRTRPLLPPERLDAVQLLSSITHEGDPLYYRERDVDPEDDASKTAFGWKKGFPDPPQPGG